MWRRDRPRVPWLVVKPLERHGRRVLVMLPDGERLLVSADQLQPIRLLEDREATRVVAG